MQTHHLFDISDFSDSQLKYLFSLAVNFKQDPKFLNKSKAEIENKVACLVFFEPSTRTRLSFEMAALRLGIKVLYFQGDASSSLVKGETILDTLLNVQSMGPDVFIIRSSEDQDVRAFYEVGKTPCLNAGFGGLSHPTQALLDAFTLQQRLGDLSGKKLVFLGDVKHSRVARSNLQLLSRLGMSIGICAPEVLMPVDGEWGDVSQFNNLSDALNWCDVVMALRTQLERHEESLQSKDIIGDFQLNLKSLASLSDKGFIMHPGPFVEGEEVTREVLSDKRCLIHSQVENGVWVRAALLYMFLTGENS